MRRFLVLLTVGLLAAGFLILAPAMSTPTYRGDGDPLDAVAKALIQNGGHGTAFHIGDGYFLTAAHVASAPIVLRFRDGRLVEAETLWRNEEYDVALLRINEPPPVAIPLSCRVPKRGEAVSAMGHPLELEWIETKGWIAGEVSTKPGIWASGLPVDIAFVFGMSGGPVIDQDGHVVGITSKAPIAAVGFSQSLTGIGIVVDGKAICRLLAR